MEIADLNSRLDTFNSELKRIAGNGNGRDLLAWTGEQLAEAADLLRRAPAHDRTAFALYLMFVARPHISCLYDAGMSVDALATALMVLMTCLLAKVNPEDMPSGYVAFLQFIFGLVTALTNDPRLVTADTDGHLAKITAMLGALENATVEAFGKARLPRQFVETDTAITDAISVFAPSDRTFDGHPITSTMALDVAADCISRLRALGLEE